MSLCAETAEASAAARLAERLRKGRRGEGAESEAERRDAPEAAAPHEPVPPVSARMARFQREQAIVDYLNRGVSIAEVAARFDVGEKRMRAIIREILARRAPAPPEYAAIQASRLNEALLVAFSAMSVTNLRAVGLVVRIVRQLDRYCGFDPAAVHPADPPALETPLERAAWLEAASDGAGPAAADVAPGDLALGNLALGDSAFEDLEPSPAERPTCESGAGEAPADAPRPEIPAQSLESARFAPGFASVRDERGPAAASGQTRAPAAAAAAAGRIAAVAPPPAGGPPRSAREETRRRWSLPS